MEITLAATRWFTFVAGALVLGSYVFGLSRFDNPIQFWGGVDASMRRFIIPFMFVAAAGFITFGWLLLFKSPELIADLRWPWGTSDGNGMTRLFLAIALFLIPSIFWLEATILHVSIGAAWTKWLTIGILWLVSIGCLLLVAIGAAAVQDGLPNAIWILLGAIAITIQCMLNDAIIWVWKFPW